MHLKFDRAKKKNLLLSVIYRFFGLFKSPSKKKLRLFLALEWIFWRLSMEEATRVFGVHDNLPKRNNLNFLLSKMQPEFTVIDIGCKHGEITSLVAERVKLAVGIDYDTKAIKIANELYSKDNLSFISIDAFDYLKNIKQTFDVCILSHVLEHIDDPKDFLSLYIPYFRYLYVEVPDFDYSYLNHYRVMSQSDLQYSDNDHIWEFDRVYLEKLFSELGLKIVSSEYMYGVQKYWCEKLN